MTSNDIDAISFTATRQATAGDVFSINIKSSTAATYTLNSYCIITQIA